MPVYIQKIATAVPQGKFEQSFLRDKMKEYVGKSAVTRRVIHSLYTNSAIKKRHTVVNDFHANGRPRLFFQKSGAMGEPSTAKRNELYTKHAKKIFVEVGKKLMKGNSEISKKDITHVITLSCTGFFAPEPAFEIIKQLGLSDSTERYHIGFMGCFATFPALKMAKSFCESNPDAVVMVVSVELCTLHLQASEKSDQLISATVFADGGAGAIITAKHPKSNKSAYRLEQFHTSLVDQTESQMAWTIGDTGFDMVLSTYIPDIIKSNIAASVQPLMNAYEIGYKDIAFWAIHPGGRAILDKIEQNLNLKKHQIASSRSVLRNYGNMSSATILFVLKDILSNFSKNSTMPTLAMAFGPGLTIESALLTKLG